MTLREAIEQYVLWRRAHGAKFTTGANLLRQFLGHADGDAECDAVGTAQVLAFLAGAGPLTRHRENKYCALAGFWRHAISRGHAISSPLPDDEPRSPVRAPPYIYSRDELRRLFDPTNVETSRRGAVQFDAATFRTLLLLLYGAGLRFSEATGLTLADVDLAENVLTIRATKFYKNRLVPIGPQLATVLDGYLHRSRCEGLSRDEAAFLLSNRDGTRLASSTVQSAFDALRRIAEVHGTEGGRLIPRLHDLRHSFAVHSLTAWYRQGADVQRLLPVLSTYLGHSDLEGTKVYLSMTPELLQQASLRFARYAGGGENARI
jgi:site-specific recombinase XerD